MDPALASYQARLETFAAPKSKSRRTSTRGKKAAPKVATAKGGWPLNSPRPEDLAYAGFVFKPTSASPDNVQCFSCQTQLDGWEETDVPAFEHLTHSPNCGFAINVCIRLRNGDPGRTEDDPLSDTMLEARRQTFAELWPLDVSAGYPSIEQMVSAGWYYDPSIETPDGVTCAYCSLSLDAWDAGDDPTEEHRKRSSDCLFFALKDLYHPTKKPKAARAKRSSSRSSTASRKTTKPRASKKTDKPLPPAPDETMTSFGESMAESVIEKSVVEKSVIEKSVVEKAPPKQRKTRKPPKSRTSNMSVASTRSTRRNKRTSDEMDLEEPAPAPTPKRAKISDISLPAAESTPLRTPPQAPQPEVRHSSPQISQPEVRQTPPQISVPQIRQDSSPAQPQTPEAAPVTGAWEPIIISNILVDTSLDKENLDIDMTDTPDNLVKAVMAGLTSPEKQMTVEEWVMYNAKRGEEKLRTECERQIAAFDIEGRRALAVLDAN